MKNWLVKALVASSISSEECALLIGCSVEEMLLLEARPGEMTLNEVGLLMRHLPEEGAVVVSEMLVEMSEGARRAGRPTEGRMD